MRREFTFTFDSGKTLRWLGWSLGVLVIFAAFHLVADVWFPRQSFFVGWIAACVAAPSMRRLSGMRT